MALLGRHPGASSAAVSQRMSAARRQDTKPEIDVRRILHSRGLRYRVAYPVPGMARRSIDVAFTRAKVAVFLDGCFWHGCPAHATWPRANADWWGIKLRRNAERDAETVRILEEAGWRVLRFWEHEAADDVADRIASAVRKLGADRDAAELPDLAQDALAEPVLEPHKPAGSRIAPPGRARSKGHVAGRS